MSTGATKTKIWATNTGVGSGHSVEVPGEVRSITSVAQGNGTVSTTLVTDVPNRTAANSVSSKLIKIADTIITVTP
jgi:hypothetical protein